MHIPDGNLFMMCPHPVEEAFRPMPEGYELRLCQPEQLEEWMALHFDDEATFQAHREEMQRFFDQVYLPRQELFFERCLMLFRGDTFFWSCFLWPAYGNINTVHWFKIKKEAEGQGLGRSLLSAVLRDLRPEGCPVFLHTQPGSFRAIKLYTDFGFQLLTDPIIGVRPNHLTESLPFLKEIMPARDFERLTFATAPSYFLEAAASVPWSEF